MASFASLFNTTCRHTMAYTLFFITLAGCDQAPKQTAPVPPQVNAAPVVVKQIHLWDEYNGRIEAIESVQVRSRVSGFIEKVTFAEGRNVKKGDVLFLIDARTYRADLSRANAELARARTQAVLSRSEAGRANKLIEAKAISAEAWEQRRATADQADAALQSAQAAVEHARLNLEWTQVRAPIDGQTGRARITAGNLVSTGDSGSVLTTLVSQDRVYVYFDADEATFLRYNQMARTGERPSEREGNLPVRVGLTGESGYPHTGKVDFIDNEVTRSTGTISVRAVLDNSTRQFTPGLFARVQLIGSGEFQAVLIDDKAVLTDQDRKYVYVVDTDGKAQRRDVKLGRRAEGLRIVESGLGAGDRVIVDGVQKVLVSGTPVDAKPVTMEPAPSTQVAAARN